MERRVHSAKNGLDWKIRLVWTPVAIRPVGPRQVYEVTTARGGLGAGIGILAIPYSLAVFFVFVIPVMLVVLPLRYARVLAWRIEAITFPWGKRNGPATLLSWRVKGRRDELQQVLAEIAAALERGNTNPEIPCAVRDD
jgi:hypothetical protein